MSVFHTFAIALAIISIPQIHAKTLTVNNNSGSTAEYTSFASAYDAAEDGDTLIFEGSESAYTLGNVRFVSKRLNYVGKGYFLGKFTEVNPLPVGLHLRMKIIEPDSSLDPVLDPSGSTFLGIDLGSPRGFSSTGSIQFFASDKNNLLVKNLSFDKCYAPSVFLTGVTLRRCYREGAVAITRIGETIISNCIFGGIEFQQPNTGGAAGPASVDRCVLGPASIETETSGFSPVSPILGGVGVSVKNTILFANDSSRRKLIAGNGAVFSNCLEVNFDERQLPLENGNITAEFFNDVFVGGEDDEQFVLRSNSLASGVGTNGSDVGAFGGLTPYVLSGIPGIPRITELVAPATATSTSGLRFRVRARAFAE